MHGDALEHNVVKNKKNSILQQYDPVVKLNQDISAHHNSHKEPIFLY